MTDEPTSRQKHKSTLYLYKLFNLLFVEIQKKYLLKITIQVAFYDLLSTFSPFWTKFKQFQKQTKWRCVCKAVIIDINELCQYLAPKYH